MNVTTWTQHLVVDPMDGEEPMVLFKEYLDEPTHLSIVTELLSILEAHSDPYHAVYAVMRNEENLTDPLTKETLLFHGELCKGCNHEPE